MKKFGNILQVVVCLSVLFVAVSVPSGSPTQAAGPPSGLDVTVTNTPLPVQGTVNIGNFPAAQPISGTVSVDNFPATQPVSISGTPSVNANITNTATIRDSDNPARQPFQVEVIARTILDGFDVPSTTAGGQTVETLVIEFVTAACDASGLLLIITTAGGTTADYNLPINQNLGVMAPQLTRIYADGGTRVRTFGQQGPSGCDITVSGYLVTA